jgi:hypothetical protein
LAGFLEQKTWYDCRERLDSTLIETPFEQLNVIFQKFRERAGKEIEDAVREKFSGSKENAYLDLSKVPNA